MLSRELLASPRLPLVYSARRISDHDPLPLTFTALVSNVDTLADAPQSALSGVARVLVHAGRLNAKAAEELVKSSREKKTSFISSVIAAGAVAPSDLAHTLSTALALPLLDLASVDVQKLPKNVVDVKLALQYQHARGAPARTRLLTALGGYHGDTLGAMSVCDPVNGMHGLFRGALASQLFAPLPEAVAKAMVAY